MSVPGEIARYDRFLRFEHIVNSVSHILKPGMAGFVHAGDEVIHKVPGDKPTKTLVIWVPAAARLYESA